MSSVQNFSWFSLAAGKLPLGICWFYTQKAFFYTEHVFPPINDWNPYCQTKNQLMSLYVYRPFLSFNWLLKTSVQNFYWKSDDLTLNKMPSSVQHFIFLYLSEVPLEICWFSSINCFCFFSSHLLEINRFFSVPSFPLFSWLIRW